jgi:hypothetical protein
VIFIGGIKFFRGRTHCAVKGMSKEISFSFFVCVDLAGFFICVDLASFFVLVDLAGGQVIVMGTHVRILFGILVVSLTVRLVVGLFTKF